MADHICIQYKMTPGAQQIYEPLKIFKVNFYTIYVCNRRAINVKNNYDSQINYFINFAANYCQFVPKFYLKP